MPNPNDRVFYLLQQYSQGASTTAEEEELFHWMATAEDSSILKQHIGNLLNERVTECTFPGVNWDRLYDQLMKTATQKEPTVRTVYRLVTWKRVAAALLVTSLSAALLYYLTHQQLKKQPPAIVHHQAAPAHDVAAGTDKATLQLADGSLVALDSVSEGILTHQDKTKVIKTADGALAYSGERNPSTVYYNTLSTPRGGQYHVTLPDGTQVWLNAASSLHYPTAFTGKERTVELTGEAYFEVAKAYAKPDAAAKKERIPFVVLVKGIQVEVLGTHFNINAYTNEEAIQTTLLEGSVRVGIGNGEKGEGKGQRAEMNDQTVTLKPGEQAVAVMNPRPDDPVGRAFTTRHSPLTVNHSADVEQAVAWKNGYTSFKNMDITGIMRQIERWYDVEVTYEGIIPPRTFSGEVPRSASLSQLLRVLQASNINFAIDGRKIRVKP